MDTKLYNIPRNHDYSVTTVSETLYAQLGMHSAYYSFKQDEWRFIMINTNEISTYANKEDTTLEIELKIMYDNILKSVHGNVDSYNGGISQKQINWLKNELESAESENEKVIVFYHHPLFAAPGYTALNNIELLEVLSAFTCTKAVISGHNHKGGYGAYKGIHCVTIVGMIESELYFRLFHKWIS